MGPRLAVSVVRAHRRIGSSLGSRESWSTRTFRGELTKGCNAANCQSSASTLARRVFDDTLGPFLVKRYDFVGPFDMGRGPVGRLRTPARRDARSPRPSASGCHELLVREQVEAEPQEWTEG